MKVVFVTQDVDPASPVLGATVAKLRALAARVDEVVVIANSAVPDVLPANCRVELFASGTQAGRGAATSRRWRGSCVTRERPWCWRTCARSTRCSRRR